MLKKKKKATESRKSYPRTSTPKRKQPKPGDLKITHLMPSTPEWSAVFFNIRGEVFHAPIAFWAAIEVYVHRNYVTGKNKKLVTKGLWEVKVTGMVAFGGSLLPVCELNDFLGYDHPLFSVDFRKKAKERLGYPIKNKEEDDEGLIN